jgi:malonate transporter MadL subunit
MVIYGTAILSGCLLGGYFLGRWLGNLLGIQSDLGSVGIAMLLLIGTCGLLQKYGRLKPPTESGILFWSSIYIPVVVAMSACQDAYKAISSGWIAAMAGIATVALSFLIVGIMSRLPYSEDVAENK